MKSSRLRVTANSSPKTTRHSNDASGGVQRQNIPAPAAATARRPSIRRNARVRAGRRRARRRRVSPPLSQAASSTAKTRSTPLAAAADVATVVANARSSVTATPPPSVAAFPETDAPEVTERMRPAWWASAGFSTFWSTRDPSPETNSDARPDVYSAARTVGDVGDTDAPSATCITPAAAHTSAVAATFGGRGTRVRGRGRGRFRAGTSAARFLATMAPAPARRRRSRRTPPPRSRTRHLRPRRRSPRTRTRSR